MVSIGPTITGPHSDEQVHIESVGHYWTLLTELLKEIPASNYLICCRMAFNRLPAVSSFIILR